MIARRFPYPMSASLMILLLAGCAPEVDAPGSLDSVVRLVDAGAFTEARSLIEDAVQHDPPADVRQALAFEAIRMDRIEKDFVATGDEVLAFIREIVPEAGAEDLAAWEESRALEMMRIDGEKRYFRSAARNLFRIDPAMRQAWAEAHPDAGATTGSGAPSVLDGHVADVVRASRAAEEPWVLPVRLEITQAIEVPAGAVPAGETIRAWIPFPREIPGRQDDIEMLSTEPAVHTLAPPDALQRTIYLEQMSSDTSATRFSVTYRYTSRGTYVDIDPDRVTNPPADQDLDPFLSESPPHVIFSPELRRISAEIIGDETNPYRKAQLLFAWVDEHIPWASAREYSTLRNIPEYALLNRHGDCGIQTLLFITLCRLNGIPARWQSGWEFEPPDDSMHDWGLVYFHPYGWVPMDVTYGLRDSEDPDLRWFYLSGMDSYRLIFNDAYSQPFFPEKTHPRSETVDSQRGEVEWDGGNLYFDQWKWSFDWKVLTEG